MEQVQHETRDADPTTKSFVVDRQAFWGRFTQFTSWAAGAIAILLVLLWWFLV